MTLAGHLLVTEDGHAATRCRWVLAAPALLPHQLSGPHACVCAVTTRPPVESSPLPLSRTPGGMEDADWTSGVCGQARATPRSSTDQRCHTDNRTAPHATRGLNTSTGRHRRPPPGPARPSSAAPCSPALRPTCAVLAGGCTWVIGYCVGTGGTPVGNAGKTPGANDTAGGTMLGTP